VKIFVAIPVYDGKLQHQTVNCLILEQAIAVSLGDELIPCFAPYSSAPHLGRNQLVQSFLDSGCERMVFLDSDITFEPGALIKLARRPEEFVAGCTRHKSEDESYPIWWLPNKELWANKSGLLEIDKIGLALAAVSRSVFEQIRLKHPGRETEFRGQVTTCFFEMPFRDGELFGEDTYFCKLWRDSGGKIFLDPELEITHWHFAQAFVGHIGKWLKNRPQEMEQT
jgi:hypothetical protein